MLANRHLSACAALALELRFVRQLSMASRAQLRLRSACHLLLFLIVLQSARSAPAQSGDFVVGLATEYGSRMTVLSPSGVTRSSIRLPEFKSSEGGRTIEQYAISSDGKYAFAIGFSDIQASVFVVQLKGSEPKLMQKLDVTGCEMYEETLSIATGAILPGGDYEVYIGSTCYDFCPGQYNFLSSRPQILKYRYQPSPSAFVGQPTAVSSSKLPCSQSAPDGIPALQYLSGRLYYINQKFNSAGTVANKLELLQVGDVQIQAVSMSQLTTGCANQLYNGLFITSSTTFLGVCGDSANLVSVNGTAVTTAVSPGRKDMRWVGTAATTPESKYLYAIGSLLNETSGTYTTNATVYRYDRNQLRKSPLPIFQLDPSVTYVATTDPPDEPEYMIRQLLVVP